jgi:hypothetical protein
VLIAPPIFRVLRDDIREKVRGVGPRGVIVDLPEAILDGIPVALSGIASPSHRATKQPVVLEGVLKEVAGDKLIVQLPQRQHEVGGLVLGNDRVGLVDHLPTSGAKVSLDVDLAAHCIASMIRFKSSP